MCFSNFLNMAQVTFGFQHLHVKGGNQNFKEIASLRYFCHCINQAGVGEQLKDFFAAGGEGKGMKREEKDGGTKFGAKFMPARFVISTWLELSEYPIRDRGEGERPP